MSDHMRRLREKVGSDLVQVPAAGAAVFDAEDRMLMARHVDPPGAWSIPGGAIDPDEAPADAVVRELWEELGVRAEPRRLLGVFGGPTFRVTYGNGDRVSYLIVVFECLLHGAIRPDGAELSEARFVARDELASLPLTPWLPAAAESLYGRSERAAFAPPAWSPPPPR
jgi:8-oxo-dGTP pyrophosphatase MutT (NUDIX family)